jgi:hypothetical protein
MAAASPHNDRQAVFGLPQVERALATAFQVKPSDLPALRGRIQHLRRLGLTPRRARGKVIQCDFGWVARWYLALVLITRIGRDPVKVVYVVSNKNWGRAFLGDLAAAEDRVDRLEAGLGDLVEVARHVDRPDLHILLRLEFPADGRLLTIGYTRVRYIPSVTYLLSPEGNDSIDPIIAVLDLTAHMKRLDAALAAAAPKAEMP